MDRVDPVEKDLEQGRLADARRRLANLPYPEEVRELYQKVLHHFSYAQKHTLVYKWNNPSDQDFMQRMLLGQGTFFLADNKRIYTRDYWVEDGTVNTRVKIHKDFAAPEEYLRQLSEMEIMLVEPHHDYDPDTCFTIAAKKYQNTFSLYPAMEIDSPPPSWNHALLNNMNCYKHQGPVKSIKPYMQEKSAETLTVKLT